MRGITKIIDSSVIKNKLFLLINSTKKNLLTETAYYIIYKKRKYYFVSLALEFLFPLKP